ncbi:DUF6507 family protein [Promicromonospora sp. NPDC057488]|uniref:DUF6507 family protein n=1 Tax=Promicromonospora sp. NPDC057488 TaxID=3346147 RepID=UPI00366CE580
MTGYRVSPEGVDATLRRVSDRAQSLAAALNGLEEHATAAVAGAGGSPVVAEAIGEFFSRRSAMITSIGTRIEDGMAGAAQAVAVYVRSDEEMARTQQGHASRVPDWFVGGPKG